MNGFDDRAKAFEAKFHVDEEIAFKARARRNKLFGQWVAGKLGLQGDQADRYARDLVDIALADAERTAMLAKVRADLAAAHRAVGEATLRAEIDRCDALARRQIMGETGDGKLSVSPS
jgi:hypothetical protein